MKKIFFISTIFILSSFLSFLNNPAKAVTYEEIKQRQTQSKVLDANITAYPYPSGSLVNDGGTIYFISGTTKVPFTNWQAFIGLGYSLQNVASGNLQNYIPSTSYFISTANAAHPWGSWLLYNDTVYYSHESGLIPIPSWETFLNNGGIAKYIVNANSYDISVLNSNPNLGILTVDDPRVLKTLMNSDQNTSPSPEFPSANSTPNQSPTGSLNGASSGGTAANPIVKKVLVLLVDQPGSQPEPFTAQEFSQYFFKGVIQKFFNEQSYNKLTFSGDVLGWMKPQLDNVTAPCDVFKQITGQNPQQQQAFLKSLPVSVEQYDLIVYLTQDYCFGYLPHATLGPIPIFTGGSHKAGIVVMNDFYAFYDTGNDLGQIGETLAHEIGHALGVVHAGRRDCGAYVLYRENYEACTRFEYGNPFDLMGNPAMGSHFNAFFKDEIGWLDSSNKIVIDKSGRYKITPFETSQGPQVAIIQPPGYINAPFYLEYRQALGFDYHMGLASSFFPQPETNTQGLMVNYINYSGNSGFVGGDFTGSGSLNNTDLLDMSPSTPNYQVTLNVGAEPFVDDTRGITIGPVISADKTGVVFDVKVDKNWNPKATLSPAGPINASSVLGTNPPEQQITVSNTGTSNLTWSTQILSATDGFYVMVGYRGQYFAGVQNGVLKPGESATLNLRLEVANLSVGQHNTVFNFYSNGGNIDIPISVQVNPAIFILPTSESLSTTVGNGPFDEGSRVILHNGSSRELLYSLPTTAFPWVRMTNTEGKNAAVASPNADTKLVLHINPVGLSAGIYHANMLIQIFGQDAIFFPIILTVTEPPNCASTSGNGNPCDYNNDGKVDNADFGILLFVVNNIQPCPTGKTCDINGDGVLGTLDLTKYAQLNNLTENGTDNQYDYNNDGKVDSADLGILLFAVNNLVTCPVNKTCDLNGDKTINILDLTKFKQMFGL